ncbi:hypothetical protein WN51_08245 [Melipona quadrifasciata]|uniref:Uncharacterized protein n=1 Tax=Melipona quadrifasciata TaxID=166423 RepID=A0A0N0BBF0_9HYME|nr:hypothetical protein WN51_08245 [Melipona quadrifasciata]
MEKKRRPLHASNVTHVNASEDSVSKRQANVTNSERSCIDKKHHRRQTIVFPEKDKTVDRFHSWFACSQAYLADSEANPSTNCTRRISKYVRDNNDIAHARHQLMAGETKQHPRVCAAPTQDAQVRPAGKQSRYCCADHRRRLTHLWIMRM